jgi:hypothetical protein
MKLPLAEALLALTVTAQTPLAEPFDIEGIRLGMPVKEAMTALRAHNANMRLAPDSASYTGLPNALTYGINAVGEGEGFYFMLTMPPGDPVVSKITWVAHFTGEKVPRQDVIVANLANKYGPISFDTLPASLSLGWREVYWIDDAQGNRVKGQPSPRCMGQSSYYMNGVKAGNPRQFDPVNVRLPPVAARLRIEEGFVNREDPVAGQCPAYRLVHARLFKASFMGVSVPNLVEYLVLLAADGPLDRKATEATHQYWLKNATSRQVTKQPNAVPRAPGSKQPSRAGTPQTH